MPPAGNALTNTLLHALSKQNRIGLTSMSFAKFGVVASVAGANVSAGSTIRSTAAIPEAAVVLEAAVVPEAAVIPEDPGATVGMDLPLPD